MKQQFLRLLVSLTLCLLLGEPARAQDPGGPRDELEAQISRGIALRRSGQDREALATFQRAEALVPGSARVQVHLGGTYQALGDWLQADEYMRRALAQTSDPFVQRHRETLEQAQRTIDEHIGLVEVDGSPASSEVRLNGERLGTLPLKEPIRAVAGSYILELIRPGYYPARRPITVLGGKLTREVLHLSTDAPAGLPAAQLPVVEPRDVPRFSLTWLPWALGGLSVVAVGVGTVAWTSRERHADRWNDDERCLRAGQTRADVCGAERSASEGAETVVLVSSLAAGVFAAGAVVTLVLGERSAEAEQAGVACGLKGTWITCAGNF